MNIFVNFGWSICKVDIVSIYQMFHDQVHQAYNQSIEYRVREYRKKISEKIRNKKQEMSIKVQHPVNVMVIY